jgi:hypothetical protein
LKTGKLIMYILKRTIHVIVLAIFFDLKTRDILDEKREKK